MNHFIFGSHLEEEFKKTKKKKYCKKNPSSHVIFLAGITLWRKIHDKDSSKKLSAVTEKHL